MKLTSFYGLMLTTIISIYTPAPLAASSSDIHIQPLAGGSFLLMDKEYGTWSGLLKTSRGYLLIDPVAKKNNMSALKQAIEEKVNQPVIGVINTHGHEDHSGGNDHFLTKTIPLLEQEQSNEEFTLVKVVAHSNPDRVIYHAASNSIFTGDIFTTDWHPTFYAGGRQGFNQAIELILSLGNDDSLIVPGHGTPTNKQALRTFRQHTMDWLALITTWQKKGKTPEQIMLEPDVRVQLDKFNLDNSGDFVPDKAFKRFIQRTLTILAQEGKAEKQTKTN